MFFPGRYGTQQTFYFPMVKRSVVDLAVSADWTPATGDTKVSKDGGNVANTTNNPSAVGGTGSALWALTLTAAEMQASDITIQIVDSATKAVEDNVFKIRTLPAPVYDAQYGGTYNVSLIQAPQVLSRATQAFDSDATSHAVTMPATVNPGDLLIVLLGIDGNPTITTPTGWKTIFTTTANSTISTLGGFCRIADGSEGGTTVDFVTSASEQASADVIRIAAGTFYPATGSGIAVGTAATGTSTTPNPPSVTPPWEAQNTLAIAVFAADDQAAATAYPTDYQNGTTKQGANATGATVGHAENILATSAGIDPGTFTIPSQEWISQTILIRPFRVGDENRDSYVHRGTAQAGASGSITLSPFASTVDNTYNNCLVFITGGTGVGQCRTIPEASGSYTGSTRVANVDRNWTTNPDSTSEYVLVPLSRTNVGFVSGTSQTARDLGAMGMGIKKNTALNNFEFSMADSTTGAGKTGLVNGDFTKKESIDGATGASLSNSISEVDATNHPGLYKINLTAGELNGDVITLRFAAAGCDDTVMTIKTST